MVAAVIPTVIPTVSAMVSAIFPAIGAVAASIITAIFSTISAMVLAVVTAVGAMVLAIIPAVFASVVPVPSAFFDMLKGRRFSADHALHGTLCESRAADTQRDGRDGEGNKVSGFHEVTPWFGETSSCALHVSLA